METSGVNVNIELTDWFTDVLGVPMIKRLKVSTIVIALFARVRLKNSSALQSPKWQLIGIGYNSTAPHYAAIYCPCQRTIIPAAQIADIPPPQSATLGLNPVAHSR